MLPATTTGVDPVRTENRRHRRYSINLALKYNILKGNRVKQSGLGATVNISSGGVLFESKDACPSDGRIELVIHWLTLPDKTLKLMIRGHIVRQFGGLVAVKLDKYEFDTQQLRAFPAHRPGAPS
jgi:hypothetical protein